MADMDPKLLYESSADPELGQNPRQRSPPSLSETFLAGLRDRSVRRLIVLICLVTATWAVIRQAQHSPDFLLTPLEATGQSRKQPPASGGGSDDRLKDQSNIISTEPQKVQLEAHIMSKCPDAKRCIQQLIVPAMEKVHDKVDFTLSFIGRLHEGSDAVECKHGPEECLGNEILLCAAHLYPAPILQLGYANCLINDYQKIPERDFVEGCALEHGLDFGKINECVSSDIDSGAKMLRESVQRTADADVVKSCTVRVAEENWCIVDGGKWSGCQGGESSVDELTTDIEKKYKELNADLEL